MTVDGAIRVAAERLEAAGVDGPQLTAELLMAQVLGTGRAGVLARLRDTLAERDAGEFILLAERRARRIPLQQITGLAEFCGREFRVTPDTLIPRPETELLVGEALSALEGVTSPVVADIGTGSGCIAVSLALARPDAMVYAVDTSAAALEVAIGNARAHGVSERVVALQGSLLSPLDAVGLTGGLDLVVSNPPYVPSGDIPGLQPEVLREPASALDGGPDGLDVIREIVAAAPGYMKPGATLLVEIGAGQAEAVRGIVDDQPGLEFTRFVPDFAGIRRVLVARRTGD